MISMAISTVRKPNFQNGVTLKRKEMLWQHIANSVNALGSNGWSVGQVRKRWKDMKSAVIDRQHRSMTTGDTVWRRDNTDHRGNHQPGEWGGS